MRRQLPAARVARRLGKLAVGVGLAGALSLGSLAGAAPAFAAGDVGVMISGGSLSGGGISFSDFGSVTLDGTQKTTTATWSMADVVDARGTGAGWNLSLTVTQLKEWDSNAGDYASGGKSLATSSVRVTTAPAVALADESSSAGNTITPLSTTTAVDTGSPVKLLSAALNGGMGSYSLSSPVATLTVPANAFAKTYKTDATVSLSTAP